MKNASLGDYLLWEGRLAKVIAETDRRQVIMEYVESDKCPHCSGDLGKQQFGIIPSSPLFQEKASKIQTIEDDDTLIIR